MSFFARVSDRAGNLNPEKLQASNLKLQGSSKQQTSNIRELLHYTLDRIPISIVFGRIPDMPINSQRLAEWTVLPRQPHGHIKPRDRFGYVPTHHRPATQHV